MPNFEFAPLDKPAETPTDKPSAESTEVSARAKSATPVEKPLKDVVAEKNPFLPRVALKAVTELPSQGLAYPDNYKISYRAYTLGEIDQLENSKMSTREMYDLILRGIETSFPVHDLTLADTMYLGLLRRLASMGGSDVLVTSACPNCGNTNTSRVDTSTIEFEDLSVPKLPIKLKFSDGTQQKFMPVTIGDYFKLLDTNRKMDTVALMAIQCRTLEYPQSLDYFASLTDPLDIYGVRQVDRLLFHGLKPVTIDCRHNIMTGEQEVPCGQRYRVQLENAAEAFIFPFRREESDSAVEITFGD